MVYTEDVKIYPLLIDLVACLETELAARELPKSCRVGLMPGASAALDFGPDSLGRYGNGQAWVRYAGWAPAEVAQGGGSVFNAGPCMGERIHEVEVGISRCEPVGTTSNNRYTPPTAEEQLEAVRLAAADAAAMEAAVCCLRKKLGSDDVVVGVGVYAPLESQGGVGGGTLQVFIQRSA
jgi:hypothetical protein